MPDELQYIDSEASGYAAFNDRAFWVDFLRDSEGFDGDPTGTPSHGARRRSTDFLVVENGTPNMSVNVGTGVVYVRGRDDPPTQGFYRYRSIDPKNRLIANADATNPRRDLLVVRIHDSTHNAGDPGDDGAFVEVVTGAPAADPELPDVPAGSVLPIGEVFIPASATSILNQDITSYDETIAPVRRGGFVATDLALNTVTHNQMNNRERTIWLDYKTAMQDFGTHDLPENWDDLTTDSTVLFADGTGNHYLIWNVLTPSDAVADEDMDVTIVCHASTSATGDVAYQISGRNINTGDSADQSGGTTITGILTIPMPGNQTWFYHNTGVVVPRNGDLTAPGTLMRMGLQIARSAVEDSYSGSFVLSGVILRYIADM